MKTYESLFEKSKKQTCFNIRNILWAVWVVLFVAGLATTIVHAQETAYYPFLQVDIGASNDEAQLQDGFVSFTVLDSGAVFNGITVELETDQPDDRIGYKAVE